MNIISLFSGAMGAAIVAGIFGLIMWLVNRRASRVDHAEQKAEQQERKDQQQLDGVTCGVRMLLYDRIKHLAKVYITRGSVTTEELEDLTEMHKIYHNQLGGNGFLDKVMAQVNSLPLIN